MKLFGLFRDMRKRVTLRPFTHQHVDLRAPRDAYKYRRMIECRRSTQAIPWTPRIPTYEQKARALVIELGRMEAPIIEEWKYRVWNREYQRKASQPA